MKHSTSPALEEPVAGPQEQEADLEAQLNALLAQIEEREPGVVQAKGAATKPPPPAAAPAPASTADATPQAAQAPTEPLEPVESAEPVAAAATPDDAAPVDESPTLSDAASTDAASNDRSEIIGDAAAAETDEGPPDGDGDAEETGGDGALAAAEPDSAPSPAPPAGEPAAAAPAEVEAGLDEDDLAQQIQALLNGDSPSAEAVTDAADEPAPPTPEPSLHEPAQETDAADTAAADNHRLDEKPSTPTDSEWADDPDDADATMRALDEIIADEADDVMAGEFESIDDVLNSHHATDAGAGPVPAAAPAAAAAAPASGPTQGQRQADLPRSDSSAAVDGLAGEFESPDELLAHEVKAEGQRSEETEQRRERHVRPARLRLPVVVVGEPLYRLMSMVNRPMMRLSPELRNTVGYIAILTAFNAVCLIAYGALR